MFIMLLYKVLSNLKNVKVNGINRPLFINGKFTFSMFTSGKMKVDFYKASLVAQLVKNPPAMWKIWIRSLGWERSPGGGKGYPLQYSGLENSMDYIVHGVAKSWTQLSNVHFDFLMETIHNDVT